MSGPVRSMPDVPRAGSAEAPLAASLVARLRAAGCVFAEEEAALLLAEGSSAAGLETLVRRREAGEPLELVLGWVEFCGLRLAVAPGVFVPRRRTELLVRVGRELLADGGTVVDLCCGVGAVAAGLVADRSPGDRASHDDGEQLAARTLAEVFAVDVDPVAVDCARRNLDGTGASVLVGDLDGPLPPLLAGRVDLMTANAPYVPSEEIALMPREARDFEPAHTLDGGPDGVALHRRIAELAPRWLAPGGHLLIESSERQAGLTAGAMSAAGLTPRVLHDDGLGATVVVGQLPAGG